MGWIFGWFRPFPAQQRKNKTRRIRIRVEELETRTVPTVFSPAQIRHAYGFDQVPYTGAGKTIAIVDAFDDPNIANDLHVFDTQWGLPDPVFTKVNQNGGTSYPSADAGWATEIALDVEWAHAIAPQAHILLVEASSNSFTDMFAAVGYAASQPGVVAVSMSWGSGEFNGESAFDSYFTGHPGVVFVASSGDNGAWFGPEYPAVSPYVLAVGGTTLNLTRGNYSSESGWSGSGGGYSSFEPEPLFQQGKQTSGVRSNPDVAYDANPNTGVYVYDSVNGAWFRVGGTSAGAPQWAGLVALADQGRSSPLSTGQVLNALYSLSGTSYSSDFHDIASGSNGYQAHTGYDLVTGLGSPKAPALINFLVNTTASSTVAFKAATSSSTPSGTPQMHTNLFATSMTLPTDRPVDASAVVSALSAGQNTAAHASAVVMASNNGQRPAGAEAALLAVATPQFARAAATGTEGPETAAELLPPPFEVPGTNGSPASEVTVPVAFTAPLLSGAITPTITAFAAPAVVANEDPISVPEAASTVTIAANADVSVRWEALLLVISLAFAGGCGNSVLRSEETDPEQAEPSID
jgi:subtilase family serine protease